MRYALIFVWIASLAPAADRDPVAVLSRASAKVRARAASLPNYTCVETVNRDYFKPLAPVPKRSCADVLKERLHASTGSSVRLSSTDRLRLDVTLTERGEIYSWAGATKFEEADIGQIVRHGPIGTGSFGALLAIVFGLGSDAFHYEGSSGSLMEYSYRAESDNSRYRLKTADSWVYTAYSGTFQVDPETDEVIRLTLETDELPPSTGSCQTGTRMEFGKVSIGDGEFLLPKQGRQYFVDTNSEEVQNTTTFAACREYRGDSTVTFFAEPEAAAGKGAKAVPSRLTSVPERLPFTFELTTPIETDTAAAGDRFAGRLVSALRDSKGKVLAPAHALVEGRVLRMEIFHTAPLGATLVLKLRTVEIGGVKVPIAAVRAWARIRAQRFQKPAILLPYSWEENAGVFELSGDHAVMMARTRSDWVTRTAGN